MKHKTVAIEMVEKAGIKIDPLVCLLIRNAAELIT
jgi:ferritin-like protein